MNYISKTPVPRKWMIFIITHKTIFPWLYAQDPDFNLTNYQFTNITSKGITPVHTLIYQMIDLPKQPGFTKLGDYYVETEAIYNIYKNPKLYAGLAYIGFMHYDFELLSDGSGDVTRRINNYLANYSKAHISFSTNNALAVYNLKIIADENQPNTFCGSGVNCYDYILCDYNQYFHTSYTIDDFFRKKDINMCSCFLVDINTFFKMMGFIAYVIESGKLAIFDTQHQYKMHGHLMERYFSLFLAFEFDQFLTLMLPHHTELKMR